MSEKFIAEASALIKTTPSKVWDALTNPAMIKQWLFGTEAVSEWKKGSSITYKGVWEGKPYEDKGVIKEIEPEKYLFTTYWSAAFGPDLPENYQDVEYTLEAADGGTKLTIRQSNVPSQNVADHSKKNWEMVLQSLNKLLEQ